jgi:lysophospholipase L1-like esterase
MILFLGDSLAVDTPLQHYVHERVITRAEVGIGSEAAVRRFLRPLKPFDTVVVSLGTNDATAAQTARSARKIKRAMNGRCLLWTRVQTVPNAAAINRRLRALHIRLIPWTHTGSNVHPTPAGYRAKARLTAHYVKRYCH